MPRGVSAAHPKYRKHRATGQALVHLDGRDYYLGPHGTKASRQEYDRLISEWTAGGRTLKGARETMTVVELAAAYKRWARGYYNTRSYDRVVLAMRAWAECHGRVTVVEFGPLALQSIQARLAGKGLARSYVNDLVATVKAAIKWGVSQELIPASVHHAISTVPGLKRGRSACREPAPIGPVADVMVDATLPHLPPIVADMVRLQRLLGCRPGEICNMRPSEVDRSKETWLYRPATHKTAHHGHQRTIFIGPKAQAILAPYLLRDAQAYCFSPAESDRRRKETLRANRKSRVQPSQVDRSRPNRKRKLGDHYERTPYLWAIRRACAKAFPPPADIPEKDRAAWAKKHRWHPNQLRHSAATEIRQRFGIEAAQHVLGHSKLNTTEIYAERNLATAEAVARQIG